MLTCYIEKKWVKMRFLYTSYNIYKILVSQNYFSYSSETAGPILLNQYCHLLRQDFSILEIIYMTKQVLSSLLVSKHKTFLTSTRNSFHSKKPEIFQLWIDQTIKILKYFNAVPLEVLLFLNTVYCFVTFNSSHS